jgi:N-acetyl-anhydromuramoyl-L-alanine amidase
MKLGAEGWIEGALCLPSPNCDEREEATAVSLLVLHSISLPPRCYGGDAIERLFANRLDSGEHPYYEAIAALRVSAHFLIRRDGALTQFVPTGRRAWHAGASSWRGRARCNDFSIGVELEGSDADEYTAAQYATLASLVRALRDALPLRHIAGHSDVAPDRKSDPGARFDWVRLLRALAAAEARH